MELSTPCLQTGDSAHVAPCILVQASYKLWLSLSGGGILNLIVFGFCTLPLGTLEYLNKGFLIFQENVLQSTLLSTRIELDP